MQMSIFDQLYPSFKITKPLKLIELFSGYGSQALALKYLGVNFEHFRICEWAVPSIEAYNDIHIQDFNDYSKDKSLNEVIDYLADKGISMDYNKPMNRDAISRRGEEWIRRVYNNVQATKDTVDIMRTHGSDFFMRERKRECAGYDDLLISLPRPQPGRQIKWHERRQRHKIKHDMASRQNPARDERHETTAGHSSDGKCSSGMWGREPGKLWKMDPFTRKVRVFILYKDPICYGI